MGGSGSLESQMLDKANRKPVLRFHKRPNAPRVRAAKPTSLGIGVDRSPFGGKGRTVVPGESGQSAWPYGWLG